MSFTKPIVRPVVRSMVRGPVVKHIAEAKFGMYSESQLNTMITSESYIPIATANELDALRNATAQTFGAGSKWEGTYTSGVDKKYVLIDDIDLEVAPYNTGEGWEPIQPFSGTFDMAGRFITNLYTNRDIADGVGLFGRVPSGATIKNGFVHAIKVENTGGVTTNRRTAVLVGQLQSGATSVIENCAVAGVVLGRQQSVGGLVGFVQNIDGESARHQIKNCLSFASVIQLETSEIGGLVGNLNGSDLMNCYSTGDISPAQEEYTGGLAGRILENSPTISDSYYNTTTSGQSDTGKGTPKTTAELLAGTPSAEIYTDWDTAIWEFKPDRYPIQRIFGEQAVHRAPPGQPTATIDGGNIVLTWADAPSEVDLPDGYFVYQSIDNGLWTKLNDIPVTLKTYSFAPTIGGEYNFFVAAYYNDAAYKIKETGNSQVSGGNSIFDDVPDEEGLELMAFYEATDGDNWTTNTNWLTDSTVNNWHGVTVAGGHVTEISMGDNNVNGTFDFDLTVFSALDIFDIYLNPNWVSDLTNMYFPSLLRFFRCYGNALSGDLSTWVVNANFRQLTINAGSFTGVPDLSLCTLLYVYQIRNSGLNAAAVDAHIDALYALRDTHVGTPKPWIRLDVNGEPSAAAKLKIDELVCDYAWEIDAQNHVSDCGE